MPGSELSFDFRNLLAAALDSCRIPPTFPRDLVERTSIAC
jgi:hypothetical protein